ncbi:hypothetical protein [Spongiimicrobium salis]|uniref:hypothetical protein n=1 Tax=Spongiimicrobium salis TaxID=1667022 RepID=UPI00374DF31B
MELFEELQTEWDEQAEIAPPKGGPQKIKESVNSLKNKQKITYVVLGTTIIILIGFFFYISAYRLEHVAFLLGLMIAVLFLRIVIEVISVAYLKRMNRAEHMELFLKKILYYYKVRKGIHYLITPVLFFTYWFGFVGLLPYFKQSLSLGFYTYIQVSSLVIFLVLGIFIGAQVKKELRLLKELQLVQREVNKKV